MLTEHRGKIEEQANGARVCFFVKQIVLSKPFKSEIGCANHTYIPGSTRRTHWKQLTQEWTYSGITLELIKSNDVLSPFLVNAASYMP